MDGEENFRRKNSQQWIQPEDSRKKKLAILWKNFQTSYSPLDCSFQFPQQTPPLLTWKEQSSACTLLSNKTTVSVLFPLVFLLSIRLQTLKHHQPPLPTRTFSVVICYSHLLRDPLACVLSSRHGVLPNCGPRIALLSSWGMVSVSYSS